MTVALPSPPEAVTDVGLPGVVTLADGVTALEDLDSELSPISFVAETVNVYSVPFESLSIVASVVLAESIFTWLEPGVTVTVYPVTALPPFDPGALQVTVALPSPADAETLVGASGTPLTMTELEDLDAVPSPTELIAIAVKE